MSKCTGCGVCQEKCPSRKAPNEFNRGLDTRSAIYTPFAQAIPNVPVIDREHCIKFKTENAASAPGSVRQGPSTMSRRMS